MIAAYITALFLIAGITWVFYLGLMNFKGHWDQSTLISKVFILPWFVVGLFFDFMLNCFVGSLIFLEPPKEWLFTDRLRRHIHNRRYEWRDILAVWICRNFLNPFDPEGDHCREL